MVVVGSVVVVRIWGLFSLAFQFSFIDVRSAALVYFALHENLMRIKPAAFSINLLRGKSNST